MSGTLATRCRERNPASTRRRNIAGSLSRLNASAAMASVAAEIPSRHVADVAHVAAVVIAVAHPAVAMPMAVVIAMAAVLTAIVVIVVIAHAAGTARSDKVARGQAGDPGEGDRGVVGQRDGDRIRRSPSGSSVRCAISFLP